MADIPAGLQTQNSPSWANLLRTQTAGSQNPASPGFAAAQQGLGMLGLDPGIASMIDPVGSALGSLFGGGYGLNNAMQDYVRNQQNPFLAQTPGLEQLQRAGVGQYAAHTGLKSPQETAYLLGQQALAQQQPQMANIQDMINQMGGLTNQAMNQVQPFYNQQAGVGQQVQNLGLGNLGQSQLAQLQALGQMQGVTGYLNPQMQQMLNQQQQAANQQAFNAAYQNVDQNTARLAAQLGARGLDSSSIFSRGAADISNQAAQQFENARLQNQQNSIAQEQALRQLLLAQTQGQAGIGQNLGSQGLQTLGTGAGLLGQYNPLAATQAQLGLLGQQAGTQQGFTQQQLQNQLQALQLAMSGNAGAQGGMSAAGKTIGGALSGAGTGAAIGSAIPGLGTAIGAGIGGLGGGLAGLLS